MAHNFDRDSLTAATVLTTDRHTQLPTLIRLCTDLHDLIKQSTALQLIVCVLDGLPDVNVEPAPQAIIDTARLATTAIAQVPDARLYRTAHDSFAIVLPRTTRPATMMIAEQLRQQIERLGSVTATLAVGSSPHDANEAGALLAVCEVRLLGDASERNRVLSAAPVESLPPTAARLVNMLISRLVALVELGAQLRETEQQAYHDTVTGLPNARSLEQTLPRYLERSSHDNNPMALLLIDGDNLKEYNTRYGYAAGNEWIRAIANTLAVSMRPGDFVARWMMGDEFIVLLSNTTRDQATEIAERLRAAVELASEERGYPGTISVGVISVVGGADTGELLEYARDALSHAKEQGKNQTSIMDFVARDQRAHAETQLLGAGSRDSA